MAKELAYFTAPFRASFERPYGYGWLLALAQELKQSSLPQAERWYQTLQPLTRDIRQRLVDYLSKLTYPIRVGTHYNTAFALALGLDYARAVTDDGLEQAIPTRRRAFIIRTRNIRRIMSRAATSISPGR